MNNSVHGFHFLIKFISFVLTVAIFAMIIALFSDLNWIIKDGSLLKLIGISLILITFALANFSIFVASRFLISSEMIEWKIYKIKFREIKISSIKYVLNFRIIYIPFAQIGYSKYGNPKILTIPILQKHKRFLEILNAHIKSIQQKN